MMNLFALSLVFTSLFAAEVWSPGPAGNHPQEQQVEDVIEKEGHRVIVVETYEENGHHNTKVSISPEQPHPQQNQRQDGGVKFKSPSLVEKAKEKMEEEADYVHPNVGKGVFHGSGTEKRYPSEILCDGLGKCTQGVAKVLHLATGKVSEVAHDVMDKKKEMEHRAKDKAENLYEEAKNTASEKAHEAKGCVEDVYEKAKKKTAKKAQDGKECAQESLNKVKNTVKEAKDSGKTIMSGVVHNITEKSEEASWVVYADFATSSLTLRAKSFKGGGIVTCPYERRSIVTCRACEVCECSVWHVCVCAAWEEELNVCVWAVWHMCVCAAWEEELKCPGGSPGVSSAGVGERVPCCGVHVVSKVLASRLARLQKEATCAEMGSCVNQKGND